MKSRKLLLYASLGIYLLLGCRKSFTDKIFTGIDVTVDINSYLSHQVQIQFANANPESAVMPTVTSVTISGKDSRDVYDINGSKSIAVADNLSQLVISPGQSISSPKIFDVTVQANGFVPLTKRITISPNDSSASHTFLMIEKANAPKGIVVKEEYLDLSNLAAGSSTIVSDAINTETEQKLQMSIPVGTKFMDENRNELSSAATTRIVHYNATTPEVKGLIPENIQCTSKKLIKNNIEADDAVYIPVSVVDIQAQAGGKNVAIFSNPVKTTVEISNNTYNYTTSTNIVSGDQMVIYRKGVGDANWTYANDAIVKQSPDGKLYVDFTVLTTGSYVTLAKGGPKAIPCSNSLTINFTRPSNVNTLHTVEIREGNGKSNKVLFTYDQVPIYNGASFTLPDKLPAGQQVSVYVYELDYVDMKGRLIVASANLQACPSTCNIYFDPPGQTNYPILRFDVDVKCEGYPNLVYYHSGRVSFRKDGNGRYFTMGNCVKGLMETDRLNFNVNYQYRTQISEKPQGQTKIKTTPYTRFRRTYQVVDLNANPKTYPPPADGENTVVNTGYFIPVPGTIHPTFQFIKEDIYGNILMNVTWFAPPTACNDYNYGPL